VRELTVPFPCRSCAWHMWRSAWFGRVWRAHAQDRSLLFTRVARSVFHKQRVGARALPMGFVFGRLCVRICWMCVVLGPCPGIGCVGVVQGSAALTLPRVMSRGWSCRYCPGVGLFPSFFLSPLSSFLSRPCSPLHRVAPTFPKCAGGGCGFRGGGAAVELVGWFC
jgi:hypothetical protein